MNLYALRDRMIDYYIQPFAAPGDNEVIAAIAQRVNTQGDPDAISQAPHHFQIWKLAEFNQETGHLTGEPKLIAECAGLIRSRVREEPSEHTRAPTRTALASQRHGTSGGPQGETTAREPAHAGGRQDAPATPGSGGPGL